MSAATVIIPSLSADRTRGVLRSLAGSGGHQIIVVDNGADRRKIDAAVAEHGNASLLRMDRNVGFGTAVNRAAARAEGSTLVLLNDDCECDPGFVDSLIDPIDPAAGIVMASAVMRDRANPALIDSAGMEVDRTLLVFDYLNGEPTSLLDAPVADPFGPSGAAAAFDRAAFVSLGGFDEKLFAYWEDVDLVLRLRRTGGSCRLARAARGVHHHSATLGSGSSEKNYLVGYGRGYLLRRWRVMTPRRLPAVLWRELAICLGQLTLDRNLAGVRGRVAGLRAGAPEFDYPSKEMVAAHDPGARMARRLRRRARLRGRPRGGDEHRAEA